MEFNKYEMKIFSLHIQFYVRFYNAGRIFFFLIPQRPLCPLCFYPLKKTHKKLEKVHGHGRNS